MRYVVICCLFCANLLAKNEGELLIGLLSTSEINKLRVILKDGFRENMTIKEIESNIATSVKLTDRTKKNGGIISKELRPNLIARTETVRLANEGLINLYKKNNIKKLRWLAALSDRTCPV